MNKAIEDYIKTNLQIKRLSLPNDKLCRLTSPHMTNENSIWEMAHDNPKLKENE